MKTIVYGVAFPVRIKVTASVTPDDEVEVHHLEVLGESLDPGAFYEHVGDEDYEAVLEMLKEKE